MPAVDTTGDPGTILKVDVDANRWKPTSPKLTVHVPLPDAALSLGNHECLEIFVFDGRWA